jgi:hypothetical protein
MTKELLQQCLDALIESHDDVATCLAENQKLAGYPRYDRRIAFYEAQLVKHDAAIEAVKQALAQQDQPAYKDGTPQLHVENSSFEDWFQVQPFACQTGVKQIARDSYAAGMGDPLVIAKADQPAQLAVKGLAEFKTALECLGTDELKGIAATLFIQTKLYEKYQPALLGAMNAALRKQQDQPAQEPSLESVYETIIQWDEGGGKRSRRELARRIEALYSHLANPALSLDRIIDMAVAANLGRQLRPMAGGTGDVFYTDASYRTDELEVFARAIEAHCRGGRA